MNKKGFTIVELLASFVLSMIIVIIMFQLIINLKDLYQNSVIKSELMNKQNIMTNKIYNDLTNKKVTMINDYGDDSIGFFFSDGSSKEFIVDVEEEYITYDNYTIKLDDNSYFGEAVITTSGTGIQNGYNRLLSINIPIYNKLFKNENFGINIVFPYNHYDIDLTTLDIENGYITNGLVTRLDAINNTLDGHMNEINEWADLSGNGHNVTLYNSPYWNKNSVTFDGETNYGIINNTANMTFENGTTWEMRIKVLSFKGMTDIGEEFFGNSNGNISFTKDYKLNSKLNINDEDKNINNSQSSLNKYYSLAMTYDGTYQKFYMDGKLIGTTEIETPTQLAPSPLAFIIGGNWINEDDVSYSNVKFQAIRVYDRALSQDEIQTNYQIDKFRYHEKEYEDKGNYVKNGMLVYLDGLNNTGYGYSDKILQWVDLSGNGNNATLYNDPTMGNNSIVFDGQTNYGLINNTENMEFPNGTTWEVRVKVLSFIGHNENGNIELFGNWESAGGGIHFERFNHYYTNLYNNGAYISTKSNEEQNINEYYTVTLTINNLNVCLYINGQLAQTNTFNEIGYIPSSVPLGIGVNPGVYITNYANVEFQSVRIYDRALTEQEVQKNFEIDATRY